MRRSERTGQPVEGWYEYALYDVWPSKIADTVSGLLFSAALFERDGDHEKAAQIRAGLKAFEGRY